MRRKQRSKQMHVPILGAVVAVAAKAVVAVVAVGGDVVVGLVNVVTSVIK